MMLVTDAPNTFLDANLFCFLCCHKRNKAIQPETGDEDGNDRKDLIQKRKLVFLFVKIIDAVIHECWCVHILGKELVPGSFNFFRYVAQMHCI